MKVFAKYVTVEAVKDKQVLALLFLDWHSKRDCLEIVKMHGMKPLKSVCGSKGVEMALEDINAETLKSELGPWLRMILCMTPMQATSPTIIKKAR